MNIQKIEYNISKTIKHAYEYFEFTGSEIVIENCIENCTDVFKSLIRSGNHVDFDGFIFPTTEIHNICVRISMANNFGFTTNLFINGKIDFDSCKYGSESGINALQRQSRKLFKNGDIVDSYIYILGKYNFDDNTLTINPNYLDPIHVITNIKL